ncbi:MAG: hypothetical protein R3C56_05990 [Pirellulaceae bacterium]
MGLSRWEVAAKLGGFMPGGGVGSSQNVARRSAVGTETDSVARRSAVGTELNDAGGADAAERDRSRDHWGNTNRLPAMSQQSRSGYSPFVWTEQIESQNFAYAPTVALGLAEVNGSMARLKNFDPTAADAASKLPKLTYNTNRFRSDGKVFIDLVRKPQNNACNYCHTNVPANSLTGSRWLHDEDVHVRGDDVCRLSSQWFGPPYGARF